MEGKIIQEANGTSRDSLNHIAAAKNLSHYVLWQTGLRAVPFIQEAVSGSGIEARNLRYSPVLETATNTT
jgi:hypothetical protein